MGDQSQKHRPPRNKSSRQTKDVADHLIESKDWPALVAFITEQAPALLTKGEYLTLGEWLHALPAAIRKEQPWLSFWTGVCEMPSDLASSRDWFVHAFERFKAEPDPAGLYLSWASIIDTLFLEWCDFSPMRCWIPIGEQLLDSHPLPSGVVEGRVASAMFTALMHSDPAHPRIKEWAQRLSDQLVHVPDDSARILMGASLVVYYAKWLGDHGRAEIVLEQLVCSEERRERLVPLARIMLALLECTCAWSRGDVVGTRATIQEGLETAERTGVHQLDFLLHTQPVYVSLGVGDIEGAKYALRGLKKFLPRIAPIEQAHWHYLAAWHDMECSQPHIADKRLEECRRLVSESNAPFQHVLHLIAIAQVRHAFNEYEEISSLLAEAHAFATSIGSPLIEYIVSCCEAHFAFEAGDEQGGLDALRKAFGIGRRQNYLNHAWCRSKILARLCIRALEADVETDYSIRLIRIRRITPESPPMHLANWPWPLKIYTLGRFSVVKDGKPLRFNGKTQRKPLEMLKALIALGGRKVPEVHISECLWPETEGDKAHSSFTSTLSRLRKLIGEESLYFSDGFLTLDSRICWVDVWAFERTLGELEGAETAELGEVFARKALGFYHGQFLAAEDDIPWLAPLRERLQKRLVRTISICAIRLDDAGHERQALSLKEFVTHL
jgi:LuxR family maltose regulon positive regulatory protein